MKKKNKKKDYSNKRFILVFTMIICLVISMSTYWMYAYYHKYGKHYYIDKYISNKVDHYISTEGNLVYINNVSEDIKNNFVKKQEEINKNNIIDMNITKGVYKDILSIKISYIVKEKEENKEVVLTTNIDLRNKKELTNDDMLNKLKVNYKDIATDIFNEYIKLNKNTTVVDAINDKTLTTEEFNRNSEKYIIRIREELPSVMNIYIDNGLVYYLVEKKEITKVCYYTDTNIGHIIKEIGKI